MPAIAKNRLLASLLLSLVVLGCEDDKGTTETPSFVDEDGDGFVAEEDCDDSQSWVYPGAAETCDGVDNDCDGEIDEGLSRTFYTDADADGYGDPEAAVPSCEVGELEVPNAEDCDDTDPEVHPTATEVCDEYVDNDCNGLADEEDPGLELRSRVPLFLDADSDDWGSEEYVGDYCPSSGIGVEIRGDCDDSDASVNPDQLELPDETDQNCDGETYYHYAETLSEGIARDAAGEGSPALEGRRPGRLCQGRSGRLPPLQGA